MKAIETEYKGYAFRSRLEARWAVFFDACGVRWEYEPEGYDLGDGIYYLPDFLLHDVHLKEYHEGSGCDIYVEVKGQMTAKDARKIATFAGGYYTGENGVTECNPYPILVVGNIPKGETFDDICNSIMDVAEDYLYGIAFYNFTTIMYDDYAAIPGVDTHGRFTFFGMDYLSYVDYDATTNAYRLARQARFEHRDNISAAELGQLAQNFFAVPVNLLTAPNGINIDILNVNGIKKFYVKAARIYSAITGLDAKISVTHPLIKAADSICANYLRAEIKRLSGGNSYRTKSYLFAVGDVPKILSQYVEHNYRSKNETQGRYNQSALTLRQWFCSCVLPLYG